MTVMQNMGYTIVAEGAETEEEVSLLREWGRGHGPGILFLKTTSRDRAAETFHVIGNYSVMYL